MDLDRVRAAEQAIRSGKVERLRSLLLEEPGLALARSGCGHPTLLQMVAVEGEKMPGALDSADALISAGAEIDGPLLAAASVDNTPVAEALLDAGAAVDGTGGWSPLEEALYWSNPAVTELLLRRGASIRNLRTAAALGELQLLEGFFDAGELRPEAGEVDWPFGDPMEGRRPADVRDKLSANFNSWDRSPRGIVDNAFVFACMHGRTEAARLLLERGARLNSPAPGFDFTGTGLHYAALNGRRETVEFLLARGADPTVRDPKVNHTPAGWAAYAGHEELAAYLEGVSAPAPGAA